MNETRIDDAPDTEMPQDVQILLESELPGLGMQVPLTGDPIEETGLQIEDRCQTCHAARLLVTTLSSHRRLMEHWTRRVTEQRLGFESFLKETGLLRGGTRRPSRSETWNQCGEFDAMQTTIRGLFLRR